MLLLSHGRGPRSVHTQFSLISISCLGDGFERANLHYFLQNGHYRGPPPASPFSSFSSRKKKDASRHGSFSLLRFREVLFRSYLQQEMTGPLNMGSACNKGPSSRKTRSWLIKGDDGASSSQRY